jgi:hypothetical protein
MPSSCLTDKKVIYAQDFSAGQWEDLKLHIARGTANLLLPCCNGRANLRSGIARRQHFAHFPGESCASDAWCDYAGRQVRKGKAPVSLDHVRIQEIIRAIAAKAGWHAEVEYEGRTPSGDRWVADVYVEQGDSKLAFEVQISPQPFSYYRVRQQRYRESGVKCVWLACIMPEVSDEEIPVFELSKHKGVFVVDFPDFFGPSLLKLPSYFKGTSLGEFVQLMLALRVLWTNDWVTTHDQLASMADWQRSPKVAAERSGSAQGAAEGFTAVKIKSSPRPNPAPKDSYEKRVIPPFPGVKLPVPFDSRAHGLLVLFISESGTLLDYWFRGDLSVLKSGLPRELLRYPQNAYAEVRNTISRELICKETRKRPELAETKTDEPEIKERQLVLF